MVAIGALVRSYWSQHPHKDGYKARYGILLDMVGGQDARYRYEGFSMRYARDIMLRLWDTAQRVGSGDCSSRKKEVTQPTTTSR